MTMAMPPLAMPPGVLPTTRMRWRLVPAPELPAAPSDQLPGKRVTVIGGQPPVAARVSAALREAGAIVSGAGHPTSGQIPDCLVDLTLTEEDGFSYQPALLRTLTAIRACYPVWADEKRAGQIGYLAVTYLGGCMGYQQRTAIMPPGIQPLGGIWAGLAKTLHREIPNCNARVVDISPSGMAVLPDLIVRELYRWGLFEIGYLGRAAHAGGTAGASGPTHGIARPGRHRARVRWGPGHWLPAFPCAGPGIRLPGDHHGPSRAADRA